MERSGARVPEMSRPRVFTIAAATPFLPTLAQALLDGVLIPGFAPRGDPLLLASATVYLPTRRATRAFGGALLDALGRDATLLPRIVPLGEVDEDTLAFTDANDPLESPTPITKTARRLILARLVLKFAEAAREKGAPLVATTPTASLLLADELAQLFDDLTITGVSFSELDAGDFVPSEMDAYWQQSLEFLKLAHEAWRSYLDEHSLIDPVEQRDRLLARETERLASGGGPTIVAGSTGSIPAVANLIDAIARRSDGAVVLPGLDQILDDKSFDLLDGGDGAGPAPSHPQFGLKRLTGRLRINRKEIQELGSGGAKEREILLSESFRPVATSERWHARESDREAGNALADLCVIEAADSREEALALALALRESAQEGSTRSALVTRDRSLARRVAAELRRWEAEIDDSAGVALGETEAGRLARLCVQVVAEQLAPVTLLALLRHPLVGLDATGQAIDALEIAALRGPRPTPGPVGLLRAIGENHERVLAGALHRRNRRTQLSERDWQLATRLAKETGHALEPLSKLQAQDKIHLADLLKAHQETLQRLGFDVEASDSEDARALRAGFHELSRSSAQAAAFSLADYADSFPHLLATDPVRPLLDRNPTIRILGPLEARLLDCDRVLLGGLNEGVWPPDAHADAWLNRPMRSRLGLDLPERRIGLAAHDFAQLLGTKNVVISRARKQNGVETVASRFLQRLAAVAPEAAWRDAIERGSKYLHIVREMERPARPRPIARPAPKPPLAARPKRLSVTEIETLVRDPYSIYARHVLGVTPLEAIDADPDAAERGTIIHEALAEFVRAHPSALPPDSLEQLLRCGKQAFARIKDFPGLAAIWWPRFERAARWLVGVEKDRRAEIDRVFAETNGSMEFVAGGYPFRLTARADRIELGRDGAVAIIDYKTGKPPTLKEAIVGFAPQLPLEAAIAKLGGFKDVPQPTRIAEVLVIKPSGGEPPGDLFPLDPAAAKGDARKLADAREIRTCDDLADHAHRKVEELISSFADDLAPYQSIPRPRFRSRFGDYDHLARIKEWSAQAGDEE
jgi:ATP-dependent helicase/nuclease subunit B